MSFLSALRESYYLMVRAIREALRQPGVEAGNIFIPLFFFAVTVGAIGSVAAEAFGVEDFTAFQMPVAVLQAVASASSGAGLGLITDIQSGYFDKLLLTPANRGAVVLGRMLADCVRAMFLTIVIIVVALAFGSGMDTGLPGGIVLVLMAGLFGLAYSGLNAALALRTGSPQAAQVGFLLFFPLLFLSPAFAPKEVFAPWLEFLATINPVTYVLEGMRELVLDGWGGGAIAAGLAAILGIGAFSWTLTFMALRWRLR